MSPAHMAALTSQCVFVGVGEPGQQEQEDEVNQGQQVEAGDRG